MILKTQLRWSFNGDENLAVQRIKWKRKIKELESSLPQKNGLVILENVILLKKRFLYIGLLLRIISSNLF